MNKVITISIALFLISGLYLTSSAQWTSIDFYPEGTAYSCASFVIGDKAYVGGGNTSKKSFYMLDLETDKWTKLDDIPGGVNRASPIRFVIDGIGYIGCGGDQFKGSTNTFYAFDPSDNSWTKKANFGGNLKHSGFYASVNGKGYVVCGTDGTNAVADVWEYDPASDEWSQKADYPGGPIYWPSGFELNDKLYVGTGTIDGVEQKEIYEYDPTTDTWTQKADFSGALRGVAVGFSINGKGYIGGGINEDFTSTYTDFFEYDPINDQWSEAEELEFPIPNTAWTTAFVHNSHVYMGTGARIFGGVRSTPQWRKINLYSSQVISNASLTQITCEGGDDGAIDISVSGGLAPYTFEWSNGQTTEDISSLIEGDYSVEIRDATGNVISSPSYQLTPQYFVKVDDAAVETDACDGGNGSISIDASTNSQELIFSWSHDASLKTNTATDLPAGSYEITVTNEFGCLEVTSYDVESSEGPSLSLSELVDPNCTGVDLGSITVAISGGHGTSSILWSGPNGFSSDQLNISDLQPGTYSVLIEDERDCGSMLSFEIREPELPIGDVDVNPTNGGELSGVITVSNVSGGVAPYQFTLYDENGAEIETNAIGVFDSLGVGNYTVEIKDADQCSTDYPDLSIILSSDDELIYDVRLAVYPNPIQDRVHVTSDILIPGDYTIRIADLLGKTLYKSEVIGNKIDLKIDASRFKPGAYFLTLSSEKINQTISLIK